MSNKNKSSLVKYLNSILILVVIGLLIFLFISKKSTETEESKATIRVGASDNASSIVLYYMDEDYQDFKLERYIIHDCWASISQWALISEAYDLAIVCKEAAKDYMKANPDFEIVGPVIKDSDILVEANREIRTVGVTNNKKFHEDFAKKIYGNDVEVVGIIPNNLPYAYENEQIDAMIIDITAYNPLTMKGKVRPISDEPYVSNVLIARSSFMKTSLYKEFIEKYNQMVDQINQKGLPIDFIENETSLDERSIEYWKVILERVEN